MFKPLVIGSRMELVSKKSLRNNEERIVYASQILDFNDDSIVCAMPIYEGRIVPLEAGKRFDAYFYVGTKIFRADCTAIDRGRDNNIHTVTIQLDSELLKFQRREYFRLSCVLPVSVKKVITLNVKADEEAVTNTKSEEKTACKEQEDIDNCKIVDISGGGIRLQSKKKYQKDDYMMLDFDLDIDGSISHKSIIGKVVESRANDNDGTLFANRLQFVDIDRLDREEIIKYIFGQQRNILKMVETSTLTMSPSLSATSSAGMPWQTSSLMEVQVLLGNPR